MVTEWIWGRHPAVLYSEMFMKEVNDTLFQNF